MLRDREFFVDIVEDGKQGIGKYEKAMKTGKPYDIVLMDLTIPGGMGGEEAVRGLLNIDPAAKVIVFSGYSHSSVMAEHSKYGFSGRLVKPFRVEDLVREISRVMALNPAGPTGQETT